MTIIDTITTEDFKTQFPRFAPVYLPAWSGDKTYFKGDVVYYLVNNKFYLCNSSIGTSKVPTTVADWSVYQSNVLNYTRDEDIENAIAEAKVNFNVGLFGNSSKLIFLYLVAFYLTLDFSNSLGSTAGITASKSVGSVSESFAVPQWMLKNPMLSIYSTNGYGRKYLSLIQPFITGAVMLFKGGTTID